MADPVSLSPALAGLPGIFTSCLDCFKYVRLGQKFGTDFGRCLAKIEALQLPLTRWGQSIGLLDNNIIIDRDVYDDANIIKAYDLLVEINTAFTEAREKSEKYAIKQKKKGKSDELIVIGEEQEFQYKKLIESMRAFAKGRQKNLSLGRKIPWAFYGRDDFNELIADLPPTINDLIELFPTNKPRMQELCIEETRNLDKENILEFAEILKNDDKQLNNSDDAMMSEVLNEHIEAHKLDFENLKIGGTGTSRFGDEIGYGSGVKAGNIKMKDVSVMGSGYTHAGHVFYGKDGAEGMRDYTRKAKTGGAEEDDDAAWERKHGIP